MAVVALAQRLNLVLVVCRMLAQRVAVMVVAVMAARALAQQQVLAHVHQRDVET